MGNRIALSAGVFWQHVTWKRVEEPPIRNDRIKLFGQLGDTKRLDQHTGFELIAHDDRRYEGRRRCGYASAILRQRGRRRRGKLSALRFLIAVDTNVLIRYVVRDDPDQTARAKCFLQTELSRERPAT